MYKLILGISLFFICNFTWAGELLSNQKPNILLILLDDVGYADLGIITGNKNRTPYINQLAKQGTLFKNHYTDATCTPTRVAIMTGRHPSYYGFRPIHLGLSPDTKTLANSLQSLGYDTHHLGKWHIGNGSIHADKYTPNTIGFKTWFGFRNQFLLSGPTQDYIHYGRETYYNPWLEGSSQPIRQYQGHLTDILTQKSVDWIESRQDTKTPWFLNLWYLAPHSPFEPDKRFSKKYPQTDIGQRDALIEQVDSSIGRVLSALEKSGQANETLVFLLSDNGGPFQENNLPFYGIKGQFYPGGVRTPLILRWPNRVPKNKVLDKQVSIFDIFTTIAAATGVSLPKGSISQDLVSLTKENSNLDEKNKNILFWEYQNNGLVQFAVLSEENRWLLVYGWNDQNTELFDLYKNPSGDVDVYQENKSIAQGLLEKFYRERLKSRVVDFNYLRKSSNGHAILTGQETQRSPGYQAFTFGIALIRDGMTTSTSSPVQEIIAQQESMWRLTYSDQEGLHLNFGEDQMKGPKLDDHLCHSIIVTTDYSFTILRPQENNLIAALFVDGELVASLTKNQPPRTLEVFENPTLIGLELSGAPSFIGKLGKPVILNEQVTKLEHSKKLRNDADSLARQLCEDLTIQPGEKPATGR